MPRSSDRLSSLLAELRQILEEERAILLSGTPQRISGVVERKLALAEEIESQFAAPAAITPSIVEILSWLERYNRGNSVICSALLRHMTEAIDRLRRHELHRSYGPDGAQNRPLTQNPLGAA
jgi:flagellar biosynthesis/type III secretory pathway chaperone